MLFLFPDLLPLHAESYAVTLPFCPRTIDDCALLLLVLAFLLNSQFAAVMFLSLCAAVKQPFWQQYLHAPDTQQSWLRCLQVKLLGRRQ